jgi:hypothetical protein
VLSVPLPAPESNQCWSARRTRFDALSRGQFRFLRRQAPGLATFFCVATEEALVLHLTALATVSTQCFANAWLSVGRDIWQSAEAWAMNEFLRVAAGFDSRTHEKVSKSSAELQLVNLIFHIFKWRE